ncbi:lipase member H-A-like [Drosophila grimshawi]|uniref:lipase member H-A-like n=1 Tax=Drosophila grimshawi TaxID=7222 RepID=UPI000C870C7B|nr:lipase member H-A-like [Drosophila grimshawi]
MLANLWLVLIAMITQSVLLWSLPLSNSTSDLSTAKFVFLEDVYNLSDSKNLVDKLDSTKTTVLYLHGFNENMNSESIQVIAEAYSERNDTNLIILDWAQLAGGDYALDAVVNVNRLGSHLATVLLEMFDQGLDIEKLHIVGHSLGGQLAGNTGREILKQSNGVKKIKRISALDPAFPLFYLNAGINKHLSKDDAEFVDVIHTDAGKSGAPFSTGTADFWPNGGRTLQPGCPKKMLPESIVCSHQRSWWFWAESVSDRFPEKFNALAAKNWRLFKLNVTESGEAVMGHYCPTTARGNYYLQTNGETPFARGEKGLTYM